MTASGHSLPPPIITQIERPQATPIRAIQPLRRVILDSRVKPTLNRQGQNSIHPTLSLSCR